MISSVISTSLSVVREKERGTMEQVRMAPLGTGVVHCWKNAAVFLHFAHLVGLHRAGVDGALWPADEWVVGAAAARTVSVSGRCTRTRPDGIDDRGIAASRLSDSSARIVSSNDDAVGLCVSDREHAAAYTGDHVSSCPPATSSSRSEPLSSKAPSCRSSGRNWRPSPCTRLLMLTLASRRLARQWT